MFLVAIGAVIANVILYPTFAYFSDSPLNPAGFNPLGLAFGVLLLLIVIFDIFYLQSRTQILQKREQAARVAKLQLFPQTKEDKDTAPAAASESGDEKQFTWVSIKHGFFRAKGRWSENFGAANGKYFFERIIVTELIEFSLQLSSLMSAVSTIDSVVLSIGATGLVLNVVVPAVIIAYGTGGDVYRDHVARELCLIFELFSDIFYLFFNLYVLSVESAFFYQVCK